MASQEGELALTFIMLEPASWVVNLSSCQSQGGELSTIHNARVREVSFLYLSSCQSQGGELSTIHNARVREVSFLYLSSCQSQGGELPTFSSCQSQGGELSTFHNARVREVSCLPFIMPESGRWVFYRSSSQGVREVSWLWLSLCHSHAGRWVVYHS